MCHSINYLLAYKILEFGKWSNKFCLTPQLQLSSTPIKRSTSRKPLPSISSLKGIPIVGYFGKAVLPKNLRFQPYDWLIEKTKCDDKHNSLMDLRWFSSQFTKSSWKSGWLGFMQGIHSSCPPAEKIYCFDAPYY